MNIVQIFNDVISQGKKKTRKVPLKEHELRKATKPPASKRSNIARKFGMSKKKDPNSESYFC